MQIDLHHTGIYVLCRIAGMKSTYAEIVAYASQQVDDAIYGHALVFKNGCAFQQIQTAHPPETEKNFDINNSLEVWMPYHFLPSRIEIKNEESQITRTNSEVLQYLLNNVMAVSKSSLALYRLGIALHCFADTYSHQDFKGFWNSYNNVDLICGEKHKKFWDCLKGRVLTLIGKNTKFLNVGHGEVLTNPDIPYLNWCYARENQKYEIDNLKERFIPALRDIYEFLIQYIENNPYLKNSNNINPKPFEYYQDKFVIVLEFEGDALDRHNNWLSSINNNFFEFYDFCQEDQELDYQPRKWFREAVLAQKIPWWNFVERYQEKISNYHTFITNNNFENSNWVRFMHAAAEHRYIILHKIFS
ncbi:MAG: hypothetical protein EOM28_06170 [Clostridia bacterium]|nr:hypothetical protein [Clostridia bacterium]